MQIAFGQPLGAERGRGLPDRQQFGMRGRIRSRSVRLPACATTLPSRTITQPTGTSPAAAAARASSSAISMKTMRHLRFIKAWMPGIKPPG